MPTCKCGNPFHNYEIRTEQETKFTCDNCNTTTHIFNGYEEPIVDGVDEINTDVSWHAGLSKQTVIRTKEDYINSLPVDSYERSFAEVGGEVFRLQGMDIDHQMVLHDKAIEAAEHYKNAAIARLEKENKELRDYKEKVKAVPRMKSNTKNTE